MLLNFNNLRNKSGHKYKSFLFTSQQIILRYIFTSILKNEDSNNIQKDPSTNYEILLILRLFSIIVKCN